jgi:alpha-amylase
MNILSDFKIRLNALVPESAKDLEITNLKELIHTKSKKLDYAEKELKQIRKEMSAVKLSQSKLAAAPKTETIKPPKKEKPLKEQKSKKTE